ncbi:UDP-N-acetylmuramate dehydrogenase [Alteribacillus persepolensis]|uniref:UDP-N-acetylenolpyruvoylglucosamine reductase n=1 Tax=Alteribacillus persepolensis TaxID=568899 RepID=A0A1G7YH09_9BACI|nr:UDP-N-acetylmuramate dehydrogenase [Alteribacillus persepolensis]SDG95160.1 UDP-N-acetylmuramate dehydrogenase [Alteribacillus persepolensis]
MKELITDLQNAQVGRVAENEPMAKHTTWKIGGPADVFIEPDGVDGLVETMNLIQKHQVPWRAVGRGSNLLVDDAGIEGAVIKLGQNISHLEIEDDIIRVGGGYSFIKLATIISKKGLSGLEFAGGIPGTVGGAVFMNAGAHGSDMSDILIEARVLYPDGSLAWVKNEDMDFSYRTSILQKQQGICVEARLQMQQGDKSSIVEEMQKHKSYRRQTQPWNYPCAGSVFRNPLPEHAGALIEKSGLKGYRIGGAQISELHGNFIVNVDNAKAQDVLAIISHVQEAIKKRYDIDMRTEVELVKRQA